MTDRSFLALLGDVVSVRRPAVSVSPIGDPRTPTYPLLAEDVPCALQPVTDQLGETVAGELGAATHTGYLEPMDLQVGDLLVEALWTGALGDEVEQGATVIALVGGQDVASGTWLEVGIGTDSELAVVDGVTEDGVELAAALARGYAEGVRVRGVQVLKVQSVRDEGGVHHHHRTGLTRLVG